MRNNNGASVRKLSNRSFKNNRMRNAFAVLAIILTGMLFTAAFSLVSGMIQVAQEETMHEVGGRFHAGLKRATAEEYDKIALNPLVKKISYNIYLGYAENIVRRNAELRYIPDENDLDDYFITLKEGHFPKQKNEIVVDTFTLDELKVPHVLGEKIPITFTFLGEKIEREFVVSGWYQGDYVSHASELIISKDFWQEIKGDRTDADFQAWYQTHPDDAGIGLRAVNLFFQNASHLEEKVRTVIEEAGYKPETEIAYGVNWAYTENRLASVDPLTFFILAGTVFVILLTGYLIIFNIFQISVMSDIRFYGLLKTIGTTKKQIRHLVNRQAMLLSVIGIPIGLVTGYAIGKTVLPFAMSFMEYKNMEISLKFHPLIFAFGAGFSALTVFLSCRRPGKIAGSVSPVEAVKYTEGTGSYKKKRKKGRLLLISMAYANLRRNKKKTGVVVAAISLSIILLTLVMTGVGSFRLDAYLEQRIAGDFLIGNVNATSMSPRGSDYDIDEDFITLADNQEGILEKNEMWYGLGRSIAIDDKARGQYQKLDAEGKLMRDDGPESDLLDRILAGTLDMKGFFYGYSDGLLENLKVLEGDIDIEKFQNGNYILLTTLIGNEHLTVGENIYHPGDTVTVQSLTDQSQMHEIKTNLVKLWISGMTIWKQKNMK